MINEQCNIQLQPLLSNLLMLQCFQQPLLPSSVTWSESSDSEELW